jgi:hypothetical protein
MGPAQPHIYPPPLNFTILKGRGISGGILYYQIMNGITGTAMPYFKRELESQKIWEVGDYVARSGKLAIMWPSTLSAKLMRILNPEALMHRGNRREVAQGARCKGKIVD